jgi:hypothetical protein
MKRNIITICVAIFVFSIFVGQDYGVAQVNNCSDCDPRFVNASGDKIRKLTVKKDLRVKRNAFVDGKVGIGTANPRAQLDIDTGVTLTGTVTITAGSTAVVGSGTNFTSALSVGDNIIDVEGEKRKVAVITDDTNLTVDAAFTFSSSGYEINKVSLTVNSGNVGIGTTSPNNNLTVKGEAGFLDSLSRLRVEIGSDSEGPWIDVNNTAGTPVVYIGVDDSGPYEGQGYIGVGEGVIVDGEEIDRVGMWGGGGIFVKNSSDINLVNILGDAGFGFTEVLGTNGSISNKITLNGNN